MEALLRAGGGNKEGHVMTFIAQQILAQILAQQETTLVDASTLLANISAAGTIHKALRPLTHTYSSSGMVSPEYAGQSLGNLLVTLCGKHRSRCIQNDILVAENAWNREATKRSSHRCLTSSSSSVRVVGDETCGEHCLEPSTVITIASEEMLQQQLSSILLCVYVQERNKDVWALSKAGLRSPHNVEHAKRLSDVALQHVGLQEGVLENIMLHTQPCTSREKSHHDRTVAVAWEQHAVRHLHGRLLPGCCSFMCTQLSGVSESSLHTQLCSGCRKARYCSIKCQREAWCAGGHALVCASLN